jgi:hypothetical protein
LSEDSKTPEGADTDRPSIARIYDYHLGGTHNYPADRDAARKVATDLPELPGILRENRAFLRRSVRFLAESGIRYFLDLGSGIPTAGNVHEIAQAVDPTSRIVYVDSDPVAVAYSREILEGNDRARVIQTDLRDSAGIFAEPEVNRLLLLGLGQPIAVLMNAVLHFVPDDAEAAALVAAYRDAMPVGSYLAISHAGRVTVEAARVERGVETYSRTVAPVRMRSPQEVAAWFDGMEMVDPGVVYCSQWRPDPAAVQRHGDPLPQICAVGRKKG